MGALLAGEAAMMHPPASGAKARSGKKQALDGGGSSVPATPEEN
jgi:hypothetical protein